MFNGKQILATGIIGAFLGGGAGWVASSTYDRQKAKSEWSNALYPLMRSLQDFIRIGSESSLEVTSNADHCVADSLIKTAAEHLALDPWKPVSLYTKAIDTEFSLSKQKAGPNSTVEWENRQKAVQEEATTAFKKVIADFQKNSGGCFERAAPNERDHAREIQTFMITSLNHYTLP